MGANASQPQEKFGTRTLNDSTPNPLVADTPYQVTSDGFVTYFTSQGGAIQIVNFLSDSATPPTDVIGHTHGDWGMASIGQCFPVKKFDYWEIETVGCTVENIRWLPIGNGVCNP